MFSVQLPVSKLGFLYAVRPESENAATYPSLNADRDGESQNFPVQSQVS
jgi:hypothetical protein